MNEIFEGSGPSLLGSHDLAMFSFEIIGEVHYLGLEGDEMVHVRI